MSAISSTGCGLIRSTEYNTIRYWQDLARLAERGKFDGIFLADIVGVYHVHRGGPAPSIVDAVQIPVNDPLWGNRYGFSTFAWFAAILADLAGWVERDEMVALAVVFCPSRICLCEERRSAMWLLMKLLKATHPNTPWRG